MPSKYCSKKDCNDKSAFPYTRYAVMSVATVCCYYYYCNREKYEEYYTNWCSLCPWLPAKCDKVQN